jgi:hypothetical protein
MIGLLRGEVAVRSCAHGGSTVIGLLRGEVAVGCPARGGPR